MKNHYMTAGLVLLLACGSETSLPSDVIPPEKMVGILVNIHQADANVGNLKISEDSAFIVMRHFELAVWDHHGVTEEEYSRSQQWYLQHPDKYTEVYTVVVDSLSVLDEMAKQKPEQNEEEPAPATRRPVPNDENEE
ncbi:MAG: DUF4296 domain-containing protein [Bacteroidota bacterium]